MSFSRWHSKHRLLGFTLAELLIALGILAEIATFTVPKILTVQRDGRYNAAAKEAAATLAAAMQQAKLDGVITSSSKPSALLPYMNYVLQDSSSVVDIHPNWIGANGTGGVQCTSLSGAWPCARLHNGGTLIFIDSWTLGGTASQNAFI